MAEQDRFLASIQANFTRFLVPATLSTAAVGVVLFLRKFGIIYQLFHKVNSRKFSCFMVTYTVSHFTVYMYVVY